MRNNKFKVWDKVKKEFIPQAEFFELGISMDMLGNMIWDEQESNNRIEPVFCTGLQDKDDREIYGSDIVKAVYECFVCKHTIVGVIIFEPSFGGWAIECDSFTLSMAELNTEDPEYEIIGNEFENPSLLEAK